MSCTLFPWSIVQISMTARTWTAKTFPIEPPSRILQSKFDDAGCVRQFDSSHMLMRMLCLCLAHMNPLLRVAPPSSSLVTMPVRTPHWDVTSDCLSQENSPVWFSIRDFLFPPEMLGYAHDWAEMDPREVVWILCSFVVLPHRER